MFLACGVMRCEQRTCLVGEKEREREVDIILHSVQLIYCSVKVGGLWSEVNTSRISFTNTGKVLSNNSKFIPI